MSLNSAGPCTGLSYLRFKDAACEPTGGCLLAGCSLFVKCAAGIECGVFTPALLCRQCEGGGSCEGLPAVKHGALALSPALGTLSSRASAEVHRSSLACAHCECAQALVLTMRVQQMRMAGSLAPHSACSGALASRQLPARAARSLAVVPRAIAAVEAPPSKSGKQSKPDGVMGQGPIIINGQVWRLRHSQWRCSAVVLSSLVPNFVLLGFPLTGKMRGRCCTAFQSSGWM